MKTIRTWVLIADAGRARVLENRGPGTGMRGVEGLELENETLPSRELGRDRPARTFDSEGKGRHAIDPKTDPHREQKRDFARTLAALLEEALKEGSYDRLVIAAPPPFLGDLRDALPPAVRAVVSSEIVKDLTKVPVPELQSHVASVLRL
ncbi:MAG: host attachment protein [Sphingomonadales bacterium]|nr:host attachment protein [Sphingomonadales bacterium]